MEDYNTKVTADVLPCIKDSRTYTIGSDAWQAGWCPNCRILSATCFGSEDFFTPETPVEVAIRACPCLNQE